MKGWLSSSELRRRELRMQSRDPNDHALFGGKSRRVSRAHWQDFALLASAAVCGTVLALMAVERMFDLFPDDLTVGAAVALVITLTITWFRPPRRSVRFLEVDQNLVTGDHDG